MGEIVQDRAAMISGEMSEAKRVQAERLAQRFSDEFRVAVAELLADAAVARKSTVACSRLKILLRSKEEITRDKIQKIYNDLKLKPIPRS